MPEHFAAIRLILFDEGIGNADAIGFRVIDHISGFVTLGFVEEVRADPTLVVVGGGDAEVGDLTRWAQGRDQVVGPGAADIGPHPRQALIGVRRADQHDGGLVGDGHFRLGHATVERAHDGRDLRVPNERGNVGRANGRIVGATCSHIVLGDKHECVAGNKVRGIGFINSHVRAVLRRLAVRRLRAADGQLGRDLDNDIGSGGRRRAGGSCTTARGQ